MNIKTKMTELEVKQMAANAVNASSPVGLGVFRFTDKIFKATDFQIKENGYRGRGLWLDYVEGRMVKLRIYQDETCAEGEWIVSPSDPRPDYQSWCERYSTTQSLINSVK